MSPSARLSIVMRKGWRKQPRPAARVPRPRSPHKLPQRRNRARALTRPDKELLKTCYLYINNTRWFAVVAESSKQHTSSRIADEHCNACTGTTTWIEMF